MRKTVLELSSKEAMKYFMEAENYCTLQLPPYFQFQKMLDFVRNIVQKKAFKQCLSSNGIKPSQMEHVNYRFLVTKDGTYSFRPIQLANPYLYYILVREITEENNWKKIQDRFAEFKSDRVEVSSIPALKEPSDKMTTGAQIRNWWTDMEQRSIELSLEYKYMFKTDITNCYGSVYTHTIDWAIEGKEVAKQNKQSNKTTLGHEIDTYISSMQYGQTNGLPQGSRLYDFLAEMVLGYADMLLSQWAEENGVGGFKILRYRDDYRIFCNDKERLERIVMALHKILADLNFQLNSAKTQLTEEIVENAIKKDKLAYIENVPIYKKIIAGEDDAKWESLFDNYQKELYFILIFSKQYPNSATTRRLLQLFYQRIQTEDANRLKQPEILIALCTEIGYENPRYSQNAIAIISYLLEKIEDLERRKSILQNVQAKFERLPNVGMIQIWLQRMTYKADKAVPYNPYTEPLCRLVTGEDVRLWNFDWLSETLCAEFPYNTIIEQDILNKLTPVISQAEIDFFDYDDFPGNR